MRAKEVYLAPSRSLAYFVTFLLLLQLSGCSERRSSPAQGSNSSPEGAGAVAATVREEVGNVIFIFPAGGYSYAHRDELTQSCLESISANSKLLDEQKSRDSVRIRFVHSREEMEKYTSLPVAGYTNARLKMVFILANGDTAEVKPPIRHELMHLLAMSALGHPEDSLIWANEGLAALAENGCNGYRIPEIFRYLDETERLIPVDSLLTDFYGQEEMVAYHQSAFLVQYLLETYGVESFKNLWRQGITRFEDIYHISMKELQIRAITSVERLIPESPPIIWDDFQDGCK